MIAVYIHSAFSSIHANLLYRFAQGIPDSTIIEEFGVVKADTAVIFGMYKTPQTNKTHKLKKAILESTKNVIIVETPLLGREVAPLNANFTYYRVGINHVVNNLGKFGMPIDPSHDRWLSMKEKLNIKLSPWRETGDNILIVMQTPRDSSLRGADHIQWTLDTVKLLKQSTSKNIIVKTHPLTNATGMNNIISALKPFNIEMITSQSRSKERFDCLKNCWATVTYCSGFAVDSIICGVPTVACDIGSFAYGISTSDVREVDNIILPDRNKWLASLAYAQWSPEEMQQGLAWEHLRCLISD